MRRSLLLAATALLFVATAARADTPRWPVWLCLPGHLPNYCDVNLSTTFVYADGAGVPPPVYTPYKAPFDCSCNPIRTSPTATSPPRGTTGQRAWLLVTRIHHAGDRRPTVRPILRPTWGLHAAGVAIAAAQLVSLAATEAAAWRRHH